MAQSLTIMHNPTHTNMNPLTNSTLSALADLHWQAHLQEMQASIEHHTLVRTNAHHDIIKQAQKAFKKATKAKAKAQSDFITAFSSR